ncbi:hypothetical protein BCR39DRAFT_554190 [Naematelia encephala]|uniref:Uncharacterized protein n=1 Tax=Naematelia encephala TaxID=71784 RepID=A0A1Y2AF96_9TREE|nr:hypothetical protein BCR39DRAFT_554190 [Naematelia encephala]
MSQNETPSLTPTPAREAEPTIPQRPTHDGTRKLYYRSDLDEVESDIRGFHIDPAVRVSFRK